MSEESRLGREAIETAYALKQLITAGVRVFFYLEDRERTLDSPTDKIMLSLTTYADELEREKARQRVTDSMVRHARAGHVTGGRCFGYANVEILGANGERSHVEQRINETEAAVVRHIFEVAAKGLGQNRIAKQLNAKGVPAPPGRSKVGRMPGFSHPSTLSYSGSAIAASWSGIRRKSATAGGRHASKDRPVSEWLRVPAPHLRIVPDALWQEAHAKIADARANTYVRHSAARESKYLLPGMARCAWCNGGMHVRTRRQGSRPRLALYACTSHYNRGEAVCRNHVQFPMDIIDRAVIGAIDDILTPDIIDEIIARVRAEMDPRKRGDARERNEQQIAAIDQQIENLADAIAIGGDVPALVRRLTTAHQRRQELVSALEASHADSPTPRVNCRLVERRARQLLTDWRALLAKHAHDARPFLREVLDGQLKFTPIIESARRGYQVAGAIDTREIFLGIFEGNESGVPGGVERRLDHDFVGIAA